MSEIRVDNITDEAGTGSPNFANGVQTSNINGGQVGGRRNRVHNGDMRISQRGTSFTIGNDQDKFTLDRMELKTNDLDSSYTAIVEQSDDAPEGFINSLKYTVDSAVTPDTTTGSNNFIVLVSGLERNDVYDLIFDQSSVISFWVKSSVAGDFSFVFQAIETDSGLSDSRLSYVSTYTVNNANTWEYKVIPIPKNEDGFDWDFTRSNNIEGARFSWNLAVADPDRANKNLGWLDPNNETRNVITATGVYTDFIDTVGATFQITGVQYEAGDTATQFEHRSFGEELSLCQRYYCKSYNYSVDPGTSTFDGTVTGRNYDGSGRTSNPCIHNFPTSMRVDPSTTVYSAQGTQGEVSQGSSGIDTSTNQVGVASLRFSQNSIRGINTSSSIDGTRFFQFHFEADADF